MSCTSIADLDLFLVTKTFRIILKCDLYEGFILYLFRNMLYDVRNRSPIVKYFISIYDSDDNFLSGLGTCKILVYYRR